MRSRVIGILFAAGVIYGSFRLGHEIVTSPETGMALVAGAVAALACTWLVLRNQIDQRFIIRLFAAALIVRWVIGWAIYSKGLGNFLGGDAGTYDFFGNALAQSWIGPSSADSTWINNFVNANRPGWGMYYYVASVYYLIGQNPLAIQLMNCALGAVTCVVAYKIAFMIYPQQRVARVTALLTAFSPSLVLWSSQGLKDGPIVLCLSLCTFYALKLRDRVTFKGFLLLLLFLFFLYSLRHYAAYILFVGIAGALLLGGRHLSPLRILQGGILALLIGLLFVYFGAGDVAQNTLDLKRIQSARVWGAVAANSGYGGDVDITDPQAALEFLPLGMLYVLFAPFPWMLANLRQMITLPELVLWWALAPVLAKGYWHAVRHRLRESFTICIFTLGLTIAYALYQTNVGTAYRHRAQLYVFFFVFISIGLQLRREAKARQHMQFAPAYPGFTPLAAASGASQQTGTMINPRPRDH